MKKILWTTLTLAVFAVGALTLTAFRGPGHGGPAYMERFVSNRLEDVLDDVRATDAQRQQILAIKDRLVADAKALRAGHGDVHKELLAQWQLDAPDAARVRAIVDARGDSMKKFADEVTDAILQVHGILTPEQRAQIAKKAQRHMEEHE
jgi:Spy/CpxP family protein refolding chaperone